MKLEDILARVASVSGAKSDAAIARALKVTPQAVGNARKRGSIPYEGICLFAEERGISLDYLFFGRHATTRARREAVNLDLFRSLARSCGHAFRFSRRDREFAAGFAAAIADVYNGADELVDEGVTEERAVQKIWLQIMAVQQLADEAAEKEAASLGGGADALRMARLHFFDQWATSMSLLADRWPDVLAAMESPETREAFSGGAERSGAKGTAKDSPATGDSGAERATRSVPSGRLERKDAAKGKQVSRVGKSDDPKGGQKGAKSEAPAGSDGDRLVESKSRKDGKRMD